MHLQENTLFDLDLDVKVSQNVAQYPLHHVIYAPVKFEADTFNSLGEDGFTRKHIILPLPWGQGHTKCCQYPLHCVTYALAMFEVAMSNGL